MLLRPTFVQHNFTLDLTQKKIGNHQPTRAGIQRNVGYERLAHVHTLVSKRRSKANVTIGGATALVLLIEGDRLRKIFLLRHTRAGSVLRPFVTPEIFIRISANARRPICIHVCERL
jgi:hypothetical protein